MLAACDIAVAGRLDALSLALEQGGLTAICGPNGAGKSTLLQCLAGLLPPDSGQVCIEGQPLVALHPRRRAQAIGYLPQAGEVAWDVSVANLVALGRLPHGDDGASAVQAAISALGLEPLAQRPVSTLSGGERARALLARVLAGEPRWILADEPFAALDLGHQIALMRHLAGLAQGGCGVLIAMHDLALAMNHADRVIVLDRGRLAADGPPQEALAAPMLARVWGVEARWLGEPGERALVAHPPG